MPHQPLPISPTTGTNRIALLDIYRGFALMGIYIVNIRFMSSSVIYPEAFEWMHNGTLNQITWWILDTFFNNKFFPIFSFLFGVGFGMQMNKMEEKNKFSNLFFIRRYSILLFFGIIHILIIWPGDVLALYALAGMIVLMIRKIPLKYLLILTTLILLFPFYGLIRNYLNEWTINNGWRPLLFLYDYDLQDIVKIKTEGSFLQKVGFRLHEYTVYYRNVEYFPILISMIFLGYAAGRVKFYNKIPQSLGKLKYVALVAIVFILMYHMLVGYLDEIKSFKAQILLKKMHIISDSLQAFLYLYIIGWLYERKILIKFLEPLAYAGRMSLTNYIMQSLVGVFIFMGFIDLYGQFGLVTLVFIAVVCFSLLVLGSKLWLKFYRYGPLEWLWRELTYNTKLNIGIQKNKIK
jgi:uncharacterized protein